VESKWKNYHIITFPGQSLSKTLEEAMDLSQERLIPELELKVYAEYLELLLQFQMIPGLIIGYYERFLALYLGFYKKIMRKNRH
jgi:hypothetical protein